MKHHMLTDALSNYPTLTWVTRQREVENALLVQLLCGRTTAPAVHADLRRYVTGELSREQAFAALYVGLV
jgi:hypothetical protein